MPRLVRTSPSYRKHKASGQAVVTLNGRDFYLGPHGTKASLREYDRILAEFLSSGRSLSFGTSQHELTIVELAADYLRYAKGYYGDGASSEYHHLLGIVRSLRELYGRSPAAEFGPLQFKALRQSFVDRDWSRNYVNANCRRIIRIFRWAAAEGLVPPTIAQALAMVPGLRKDKSAARETGPVLPVADAVVDATLFHLPAVVADMVRVQRLTGARPAEVCIMRPCDIDRKGDVWQFRPAKHKTQHHGRERTIFLGPKAQEVLLPRHFVDVYWCYARIDDPRVKPGDASTAGAWELLLWARANRDRFYESVFPRALKAEARAEAEYQEELRAEAPTRDDVLEYLGNYDLVRDHLRMDGVTTALIADVESLVTEWSRQTGISLTEEGWVALVSQISMGVHQAIEAAHFDPDAMADDEVVVGDVE